MTEFLAPATLARVAPVVRVPAYDRAKVGVGIVHFGPGAFFFTPFGSVGLAVVLVWITLWLSGGWRSEPSWIDRSGRFLGLFWIVAYAIEFPR